MFDLYVFGVQSYLPSFGGPGCLGKENETGLQTPKIEISTLVRDQNIKMPVNKFFNLQKKTNANELRIYAIYKYTTCGNKTFNTSSLNYINKIWHFLYF